MGNKLFSEAAVEACTGGRIVHVTKVLNELGRDNFDYERALRLAAEHGHAKLYKWLNKVGGNNFNHDKNLVDALHNTGFRVAKIALMLGADPLANEHEGLRVASVAGSGKFIRAMLEHMGIPEDDILIVLNMLTSGTARKTYNAMVRVLKSNGVIKEE